MENDKQQQKNRVIVISIVTLFVILCDLYIITNYPKEYLIITLATLVTLFCTMITINDWLKWKEKESQDLIELYKNIMKAEKSSCLIMQQRFQDLDNKLNFIGQKIMPLEKSGELNQRKLSLMLDSLMDDQKKIAKITISRSKENADALMNSNDELLHKMSEFQESVREIETQILSRQDFQQEINMLRENQADLMDKILEVTDLLKKDVREISENAGDISQQTVENVSEEEKKKSISEEEIASSEGIGIPDEISIAEEEISVSEEMSMLEEEISVSEEMSMPEEEISVSEEMSMPEEEISVSEEMSMPEEVMPEDIADLLIDSGIEDSAVEESAAEASIAETEVIQEIEPEPISEATPEPVLDNPNQMMTPEDIAALIANTTAEELPENTDKIIEEEKPPMPDTSNPNKVMSPEDIAALIANM